MCCGRNGYFSTFRVVNKQSPKNDLYYRLGGVCSSSFSSCVSDRVSLFSCSHLLMYVRLSCLCNREIDLYDRKENMEENCEQLL